ncbi:MAG: FHA domain-containing protein [Verrucomicrobiota bacterium]
MTSRIDLIPADRSLLPVRIVTGPQLFLGRNREVCDLVSWFLPRDKPNDRETLKLSQVHTLLERREDGFWVRDMDSASGTFLDGGKVPAGDGLRLRPRHDQVLSLGGSYRVCLDWVSPLGGGTCALIPLASGSAFRHCWWMAGDHMGLSIRKRGETGWLQAAECSPADEELAVRRTGLGLAIEWGGSAEILHGGASVTITLPEVGAITLHAAKG